MAAEYPMAAVRKDDLDVLLVACLKYLPDEPDQDITAAFGRLGDARREDAGAVPEPDEDPRPDGFYGRVELPGWRNHTGWITDEVRFGEQMCVVRDWDGHVLAMVRLGPACQVLPRPTPLKRPEPRAALPPGSGWDGDGPDDDEEAYDPSPGWPH